MGIPLAPIAGIAKVVLRGFVDNLLQDVWENVMHFRFSGGPPSNADLTTIATNVATQWSNTMAAECPSPTSLREVEVTDLTTDTSAQGIFNVIHVGTRGDDSIPANAAVLISYPVALRYKGGHPRQYLYVLGNADLDGAAAWNSNAAVEVQQHWVNFIQNVQLLSSGSTVFGGLVGIRYHGKFLPNGGPPHYYLTTPIVMPITVTQCIAQKEIASQRRRVGRADNSAAARMRQAALTLPT
jgi:hypothetical protein